MGIYSFLIAAGYLLLNYGGDSTAYELSKLTQMTKQEIVDTFGEPDEITYDDNTGYHYHYNVGFSLIGNSSRASKVTLSTDLIIKKPKIHF